MPASLTPHIPPTTQRSRHTPLRQHRLPACAEQFSELLRYRVLTTETLKVEASLIDLWVQLVHIGDQVDGKHLGLVEVRVLAAVEARLKEGDVFAELLGLEVGGVDEGLDLDLGLVEPAGDLLDELQVDQVVLELLLELEDDLDGLVGVALLDFLELFESAGLAVVEELGEFLQAFLVGVDLVGAEVAAGGEVLEGDAELGVGAAQERELFVHVGAEGA